MDLNKSTIENLFFETIKTARIQCTKAGYDCLLKEEGINRVM